MDGKVVEVISMTTLSRLRALRNEFKPYYFDQLAAQRVLVFFERELIHVKGDNDGQTFHLERWERKILRRLYGWKHRESKLRKYKTFYLEIPRKNGKSALASGLSLYHLVADKEAGGEVVTAASDKEQAAIVFDTAKQMVLRNHKMAKLVSTYRKSMAVMQTASSYKVLSSDVENKHGGNTSCVVVDEVHAQPNRELIDVLITGTAYRAQPMTILLTTAGYDKNSICWEYHDYTERVNEGIIQDPSFLGIIFAAGKDDDWTDERTWYKANPNLGVTVRLEYLREQCNKAKEVPAFENTFKRLHLNIWTEQDSRWMPVELWDKCKVDFSEDDLLGQACFVGVDLAATTDIAAVVALFPQEEGRWRMLSYFYLPSDTIERRKKERVDYSVWVREGLINVNEGAIIDFEAIRNKVNELNQKFQVKEVAMDKWNAVHLATNLMHDSFEVCFYGQTMSALAAPTKELSSLVISQRIEHNNNAVMRWMVRNVAVEQDSNGNIKISRKKSKEKIDGVAALVNALGRAITVLDTGPSVYESRGLRTT